MVPKLRRIALYQQGLTKKSAFGGGLNASEKALQQLGYIQIDTLNVVQRAHHHTLWTRIPNYKPHHLNQLVQAGKAFEYWSHAASYLPMRDYRFALPRMNAMKNGDSSYFGTADNKLLRYILHRIRDEGPLKARDFVSSSDKSGSWWNWKPTKRALEILFMRGELMICERQGMEKVYDLRERVLPDGVNTRTPNVTEHAEYLINLALNAHGFTTLKQILHLRTGDKLRQATNKRLQQKLDNRDLVELNLENLPTVYVLPELLNRTPGIPSSNIRILSPFDNLVIHRERIKHLFDFDYRLECYLPQGKRRFGYFCLPVLYQDRFAGSMDCKTKRDIGQLDILQLHLDKKIAKDEKFIDTFAGEIVRFCHFNNCDSVMLTSSVPQLLKKRLKP